jgi:hypothetical protein
MHLEVTSNVGWHDSGLDEMEFENLITKSISQLSQRTKFYLASYKANEISFENLCCFSVYNDLVYAEILVPESGRLPLSFALFPHLYPPLRSTNWIDAFLKAAWEASRAQYLKHVFHTFSMHFIFPKTAATQLA